MSEIADRFDELANPRFEIHLADTCTVTLVDGSATFTAPMVFNEFVGAIDQTARAIFQVDTSRYTGVPRRGDAITCRSRTWFVVDVRQDETSTFELRCDQAQGDV